MDVVETTRAGSHCSAFSAMVLMTPGLLVGIASFALAASTFAEEVTNIDGRLWTARSNQEPLRWREARAYCARKSLGGYADWRLPTLAELETLHDAETETGIRHGIALASCCAWSATSLLDVSSEEDDEIAGRQGWYYWGFMYDAGLRYYSIQFAPDGEALCTRD